MVSEDSSFWLFFAELTSVASTALPLTVPQATRPSPMVSAHATARPLRAML